MSSSASSRSGSGTGPQNSETEAAAWARYHLVMAERGNPQAIPEMSPGGLTDPEILDKHLDSCKKHRAARTGQGDHLDQHRATGERPLCTPAGSPTT